MIITEQVLKRYMKEELQKDLVHTLEETLDHFLHLGKNFLKALFWLRMILNS